MNKAEAIIKARVILKKHGIDTSSMTDAQVEEKFINIYMPVFETVAAAFRKFGKAMAEFAKSETFQRLAKELRTGTTGPHTNNWRKMHGLPMRRR